MSSELQPVATPIPATPALHGLVATASPSTDPTGWQAHGFTVCPENCVTIDTYDPSCLSWPDGQPPQVPDAPENLDCYEVEPFVLRTSFECSTKGFSTQDYAGRARRQLEAATSKGLEYELWTGDLVPGNPHLASTDAVNLGGDGVDPVTALVILGAALSSCYHGGRGTLHAPTWVVDKWLEGGGLIREDGTRLVTVNRGDLVVSGTGYPGTSPDGAAPAGGQAWVYATGPVQYRLGDVMTEPDTIKDATDYRHNRVEYHSQRFAAVSFDPCCHFGVLVDLLAWSGS
jgi:hypothetical protein